MPFDCTNLNSYRDQKIKYRKAAATIENNMYEINATLSYIEDCCNNIFAKIDSSGDSSSGYLADLYSSKLSVVRRQGKDICEQLRRAVEGLNDQLTKANTAMNHYARKEQRELAKKEEAEKLEAEGKN